MSESTKRARDAFTFSLRGLSTISSTTLAPAIAHDRLNKAIDERIRKAQEDQPDTGKELDNLWGRFWLTRRRRAA